MNASEDQMLLRIQELKQFIAPVDGWLSDEGIENLYRYALKAPVPNLVEIGAWKGRSSSCLASAVKDRNEGRVYSVDKWEVTSELQNYLAGYYAEDQLYHEFLDNMTKLNLLDKIEPIRMDSIEASRKWPLSRKIGLLYIDAAHDYFSVKQDFEFWSPFVVPGGFIIFDDVPSWPGPTRLIGELPQWYKQLDIRGSHAIFEKL